MELYSIECNEFIIGVAICQDIAQAGIWFTFEAIEAEQASFDEFGTHPELGEWHLQWVLGHLW